MKKGVLVYLSGPITPWGDQTVEMNVAVAVDYFCELIRYGIPAIAPQLGAAFPSCHEIDYRIWMEYDFAVIDKCTHMLMLPNWKESKGATEELGYAVAHNIPISYSIQELLIQLEGLDASRS